MVREKNAQNVSQFDNNWGDDSLIFTISEDDLDDNNLATQDLESPILDSAEDEDSLYVDDEEEDVVIFSLPFLPGADDDTDIEVDDDLDIEEEQEVEVEEADPWNWEKSHGLQGFLQWLFDMINSVPRHSGRDSSGVYRAISYFEALEKEITKAMRKDFKGIVDAAKAEEARTQIFDGLERLQERLKLLEENKFNRGKNKKKADDEQDGLVKEAQKVAGVNGIVVTVPLLISSIARACINGTVSAGHSMEDSFHKFADKYKLNNREKFELVTLIQDLGYPVRIDRIAINSDGYDPKRSDNIDFMANFPG